MTREEIQMERDVRKTDDVQMERDVVKEDEVKMELDVCKEDEMKMELDVCKEEQMQAELGVGTTGGTQATSADMAKMEGEQEMENTPDPNDPANWSKAKKRRMHKRVHRSMYVHQGYSDIEKLTENQQARRRKFYRDCRHAWVLEFPSLPLPPEWEKRVPVSAAQAAMHRGGGTKGASATANIEQHATVDMSYVLQCIRGVHDPEL